MIKALQQFIEGSTLGEFDARLELLQAFHCQLTHMDQSEEQGRFDRNIYVWFSHSLAETRNAPNVNVSSPYFSIWML